MYSILPKKRYQQEIAGSQFLATTNCHSTILGKPAQVHYQIDSRSINAIARNWGSKTRHRKKYCGKIVTASDVASVVAKKVSYK